MLLYAPPKAMLLPLKLLPLFDQNGQKDWNCLDSEFESSCCY